MKSLNLFLGGAAVGAVVALLLAPESGEKTRKRIFRFLKSNGLLPAQIGDDIADGKDEIDALMEQISAEIKEGQTAAE